VGGVEGPLVQPDSCALRDFQRNTGRRRSHTGSFLEVGSYIPTPWGQGTYNVKHSADTFEPRKDVRYRVFPTEKLAGFDTDALQSKHAIDFVFEW